MSNIKTRFAPSPTGTLHLGGARTALFSWLLSRSQQGKFILRIDDTDVSRSQSAFIENILESLKFLNIDYDDLFYQQQYILQFEEVVTSLLRNGSAYLCYCSTERLESLRHEQILQQRKIGYDGLCRDKNYSDHSRPHVVRFKLPHNKVITWHDIIRGEISISTDQIEDFVLKRSNGDFTYNLASVVNDIDHKISHIIRGEEHIYNTPKQISIFQALGASLPIFGHLPLIIEEDGRKLSKRNNAHDILYYKSLGYIPEALLNFLARLGWSYGSQEIFSRLELLHLFNMQNINNSPAKFNQEKLLWYNHSHLRSLELEKFNKYFCDYCALHNLNYEIHSSYWSEIVKVMIEKHNTLQDFYQSIMYLWNDTYLNNLILDETQHTILHQLRDILSDTSFQDEKLIVATLKHGFSHTSFKIAEVFSVLRLVLTGSSASAGIGLVLKWLGKEQVLKRISHINYIK